MFKIDWGLSSMGLINLVIVLALQLGILWEISVYVIINIMVACPYCGPSTCEWDVTLNY
jgi:hypothetical protein